jgi:hypothetical protein
MKSITILVAASLALGGCASLSDCNGLPQPQYSDCISRVNAQNAAAAAIGGALLGVAAGAAASSRYQPTYQSNTTCVRSYGYASCTTRSNY